MTRTMLVTVLLFGACDTPQQEFHGVDLSTLPATERLAPPASAELTASAMRLGDAVTFTAEDMPPGHPVHFVYSVRGLGQSCPPVLGGDCLDLRGTLRILGEVDADRTGTARLTVPVPRTLTLSEVYLQAIQLDPAGNTLSNALTTPVVPWSTGPSCDISDSELTWPMTGLDAQDWVINNYVDLDNSSGIEDYVGNAKSYNGHNGIDIDVPTFRSMDGNTPILAAAAGEVIDVVSMNDDRHTSCTGSWNVVTVRNDNGFVAYYGHLKRDSPVVSVGDRVETGDMLGVVGSSGCSTHPHLHFELHDCSGNVVDPFLEDLWLNPPVYNTALDVMDLVIRVGGIADVEQIKDPDPNPTVVQPGADLGLGLSMGGGRSGDTFEIRLRDPSGNIHDSWSRTLSGDMRHHFWWWNPTIGTANGTWQVDLFVNGARRRSTALTVRSSGDHRHTRCYESSAQRVCWNIDAADYQDVFNSAANAGFKPVRVDVSSRSDGLVYNAIFQPSTTRWVAWHGLDAGDHQDAFNTWTSQGYRITHVDGAMGPSGMRYTAVAELGGSGGWAAHHHIGSATHQQTFEDHANAGLRAVSVSVAADGNDVRIASLYDTASVGGWVQNYNIATGDYQDYFETWTQQGMWPAHIDAYADEGWRFSAVMDSRPTYGAVARHGIRSAPMFAEIAWRESQGMLVETLSTYGNDPDPVYVFAAAAR